MVVEYRFSDSQRRKYIFRPVIRILLVIAIATVVGVLWFDIRSQRLWTVIGFTWCWIFFVHFLPLLVMAFCHSWLSRGTSFAIDTVNNTYHYMENNISLSFRLNEIDKVIKVVSPPKFDKRIDILGFGYFFFWKVELTNGRTLSISCMLLDADHFLGKEATLEKRLFPIPPSNENLKRVQEENQI